MAAMGERYFARSQFVTDSWRSVYIFLVLRTQGFIMDMHKVV